MAHIQAFRAVRPQPQFAKEVASLPYDVMSTEEAKNMAQSPFSFLHVSRAEIDLPKNTPIHSPEVYAKAANNFKHLLDKRILIQDQDACLYIYALTMNNRTQYGLVACSAITDYFNDIIKKHEFTRPEKEQDRIEHMKAVRAHVGPIFLTYPQNNDIDKIIKHIVTHQPSIYDFTTEDAIAHQAWQINDKETIAKLVALFELQPYTYIADGHHRAASAAKVGRQLQTENIAHHGKEEYNYFLSVLFPHNQLEILDYNRIITDLNNLQTDEFLNKVTAKFYLEEVSFADAKPKTPHQFGMYTDSKWYTLIAKEGTWQYNPVDVLDVSILSENILKPILNIQDQRTDQRIDFVGGIRGLQALQNYVDDGRAVLAFALYPVSIAQLMAIADSGEVMPPKSTWFEPKLRDGLFSHLF